MLPPERQVDCACDVRMHRAVLHDHTGWNVRVTACMRCGVVTATRSIIEEPRPHDVRCIGNEVTTYPREVIEWLARWPRITGESLTSGDWTYLPHGARAATHEDLVALEATARSTQRPLRIDRLRAAAPPTEPPPASLARELQTFRDHAEALALPVNPTPASVLGVLARCPSVVAIVAELLVPGDPTDLAIADALRSRDPELRYAIAVLLPHAPALIGDETTHAFDALLAGMSSELEDGASSIVALVGVLGARMKRVLPTLEALATRVDAQREYYFHKAVVQAAERLRAKP